MGSWKKTRERKSTRRQRVVVVVVVVVVRNTYSLLGVKEDQKCLSFQKSSSVSHDRYKNDKEKNKKKMSLDVSPLHAAVVRKDGLARSSHSHE